MYWGDEIIVWVLLVAAVATDLRTGKIYNLLTFPFVILGIGYRYFTGGEAAFVSAFYAVGAAFLLFFPIYLLRIFGAGDVKLLMAVGAWTDTDFVIRMGLTSIVLGAAVGFFLLIKKHGLKGSLRDIAEHLRPGAKQSLRIPFAPAFLCAFMWIKIAQVYQW